jgi:hypothetical protein
MIETSLMSIRTEDVTISLVTWILGSGQGPAGKRLKKSRQAPQDLERYLHPQDIHQSEAVVTHLNPFIPPELISFQPYGDRSNGLILKQATGRCDVRRVHSPSSHFSPQTAVHYLHQDHGHSNKMKQIIHHFVKKEHGYFTDQGLISDTLGRLSHFSSGEHSMKRTWVVGIGVFSLVFAGMACNVLGREVPLEDTTIPVVQNEGKSGDTTRESIEIASIDLTRVWKSIGLNSYRSDFLMESRFNADSDSYDLVVQSHFDVTKEPNAQYISSTHQNKIYSPEGSSFDSEIYIIDGIAYFRSNILGDEWSASKGDLVDALSEVLVSPQDYVFIPEKAQRKPNPEMINGISCWHYFYDETAFEDQNLHYRKMNTDLWIAVEGGYIVRSETEAYGGIERENLSFNLPENAISHTTFNMTDFNADFTILLPPEAAEAEVSDLFSDLDSEWTRDDVPFPEETEIEYSFEDSISLQTSWTVQRTKDFMLSQMQANGWVLEMEHLNSEDCYMGDYSKDKDFLTLSIDKDFINPDMVSIHVTVVEIVPWAREDVPLPQDALIEQSFEGEVTLLTFLSLEDATETMTTQLEANGWTPEIGSSIADSEFIGTFIKGTETLSLFIISNIDEQSRTRIWITIE